SCDEIAAGRFTWSKPLLLRLCDDRQDHANCRAFFDFALRFDVTAMELRYMFHDRQAETGSPNVFSCARFVDTIEALENARQIFFADADPVVAYAQHDLSVAPQSHQRNLAALTRVFHRVIEQIV